MVFRVYLTHGLSKLEAEGVERGGTSNLILIKQCYRTSLLCQAKDVEWKIAGKKVAGVVFLWGTEEAICTTLHPHSILSPSVSKAISLYLGDQLYQPLQACRVFHSQSIWVRGFRHSPLGFPT